MSVIGRFSIMPSYGQTSIGLTPSFAENVALSVSKWVKSKTIYSGRLMAVDAEMLEALKAWKQTSQFSAGEDWIFASPVQLGALPWCYPRLWRVFQKAAAAAQIGKLAIHTMRHTYRSWTQ